MNKENIFKKYKYLILILVLTFLYFIYCYWKNSMGLFFDIPAMFTAVIHKHTMHPEKLEFLIFIQQRIRLFSDILVAIPLNIIMLFIKNKPALTALNAFSMSYFITHITLLVLNYLVAKRTKRYDIAIIALAFYFIYSIPNIIWIVRELHIAYLLCFISISYFLSKNKLNWLDTIPILLVQIFLFESFETTALFGLIMSISTIIFLQNKEHNINIIHKIIIGFTSLGITFYIPIKLYIENINIAAGTSEWLQHHELAIKNLFSSNLIIPFFATIAIFFFLLYKKEISKKNYIIGFSTYILLTIIITYVQTSFKSHPIIEVTNYAPILWFFFPTITALLSLEYFKIDLYKKNAYFYSNLLIITCIFGILNLLWQINSANDFGKYQKYIKNLIDKSETTIVNVPKEVFSNNDNLRYATCFGITAQSLFLQTKNKPAKLILPQKDWKIYNNSCADDIDNTFYDADKDNLRLQSCYAEIKTNYWDLTGIKEDFIKTGRIKN